MKRPGRRLTILLAAGVVLLAGGIAAMWWWMKRELVEVPVSERSLEVRKRVLPRLRAEAGARGLRIGAPVFMRAFKEPRELEVWIEAEPRGPFALFRTYHIANWGQGTLGPKLKEGDGQSPEGFYSVAPAQLNPLSDQHLSFNTGYPNAYDRAQGRTGSFIMIHGGEASIGCLAVTDAKIEEVYLIAEAALRQGQPAFPVHLFPFHLTAERLEQERASPWFEFWQNLREGCDFFEKTGRPPDVGVGNGRYVFGNAGIR